MGVDAHAAGMREVSGKAFRSGLANLFYVRAAVEELPRELAGVADRVTVVLPWGSLLAAVARPSVVVLRGVRTLCRPAARLEVVLGHDAARDRTELERLGVPARPLERLGCDLGPDYASAGFTITKARPLGPDQLSRWPSSWARRLAHGSDRSFALIEARAEGAEGASGDGAGGSELRTRPDA